MGHSGEARGRLGATDTATPATVRESRAARATLDDVDAENRPRPGEEWRTPEGRMVFVESIAGESVMGNATAVAVTNSGELVPSAGATHYDGRVADFSRYELVGPRWTLTLMAPALGAHPSMDPVWDAITAVASVKHREVGAVVEGTLRQDARYEAIVVGLTADEAIGKVRAAVAGHGDVTVLRTSRAL